MKGLIDGLSLYVNNNQASNYSQIIYNNLIKYSSIDINILKDYEIKSDMYKGNTVELLLDRVNNDFSNLKRHLSKENYSFYHCLNNGFSFLLNYDFNYIMNISTLLPLYYENFCNDKYVENFFRRFPYSVLKSNGIVCPSISCKIDFLKEFEVSEEMIFVNYGTISDFFIPIDKYMASLYIKSKFNIENEFIIFYGDFNKRKNLDKAILLFYELKKEIKNLSFLICSNTFNDLLYLEELKILIEKLRLTNSIVFLQDLSLLDMVNLFNKALCFIDLSLYENVNLNIVNAYSCGVPIVCSYIPLYREYLGDDCFYYYDKVDRFSLLNHFNKNSLHNENYVLSKFNKLTCVDTCLNIYNTIAK